MPPKIYELLEVEILKYMHPSDNYQIIIDIVIFIMLIWNIVSPILEIGDYIEVYKELQDVIGSLNVEKLIDSIS